MKSGTMTVFPGNLATVFPNMVGCIGKSVNPEITMDFTNSLCVAAEAYYKKCPRVPSSAISTDGIGAICYGTMPEFKHLKTGNENEAGLLLRMFCKPNQKFRYKGEILLPPERLKITLNLFLL